MKKHALLFLIPALLSSCGVSHLPEPFVIAPHYFVDAFQTLCYEKDPSQYPFLYLKNNHLYFDGAISFKYIYPENEEHDDEFGEVSYQYCVNEEEGLITVSDETHESVSFKFYYHIVFEQDTDLTVYASMWQYYAIDVAKDSLENLIMYSCHTELRIDITNNCLQPICDALTALHMKIKI